MKTEPAVGFSWFLLTALLPGSGMSALAADLPPFVEHTADEIATFAKAQAYTRGGRVEIAGCWLDLLYGSQDDLQSGRLAVFQENTLDSKEGWRVGQILDDATMTVYFLEYTKRGKQARQPLIVRGVPTKGLVENKPLELRQSKDWFLLTTGQLDGRTLYVADHIDAGPVLARLPRETKPRRTFPAESTVRSRNAWRALRDSTRQRAQELIDRFPGTPEAEAAARLLQAAE